MRIVLASDHAGFKLKKEIINFLASRGIEHQDVGCDSEERADYVDFGMRAMGRLTSGEFDRAVLVCGTGMGMAVVANKYRGVRATTCTDEYMAEMSRGHNDSNCLTLGGRILPPDEAQHIVRVWLETEFEGGRHRERLEKIEALENRNFKPV